MMFLFAYISLKLSLNDWPVGLIRATEVALLLVACGSFVLARRVRDTPMSYRPGKVDIIATIGGISTSIAVIMPFELAPVFFGAKGEIMLATILLIPLYPAAAVLFYKILRSTMRPTRPPALPSG